MRKRKPGLALLSFGLLILISSLGLAACGEAPGLTVAAVATPTVNPATATITATAPTQTPGVSTPAPTTSAPATSTGPARGHDVSIGVTPGEGQPQQSAAPVPTTPATSKPTVPAPTATVPGKTAVASGAYPGKIVYDTTDYQIFITRPDGTGRQKVADGFSPLFSPDGQRIAYLTRTEGSPLESRLTVNTINLDGTNHRKLCETAGNVAATLVRWSPRDRFIALTLTQQDGPGTLYLCNTAEGSLNKGLTTTQGAVAGLYDWTPDGENAVWQAGKGLDFNLYYGDPDKGGVGAVALTKGQHRLVSAANKFQYYPAARISPDGKTLAIGGGSLSFIALPGQQSRLDGQNYVGAEVRSLAWSPDGRAVVLLSLEPGRQKPVGTITIQDVSGQPGPPKTLFLDENLGTSVDWSRQ